MYDYEGTCFKFDIFDDDLAKSVSNKQDFNNNNNKIKTARKKPTGGYKPVLVDLDSLKSESKYLEDKLAKITDLWKCGELSNQDVTTLYIIFYLHKRYSHKFLENYKPLHTLKTSISSRNLSDFFHEDLQNDKKLLYKLNKTNTFSIFDLINNFNLHNIPLSARTALVKWYTGKYDIVPLLTVATVTEVIHLQANRKRCVTLAVKNLDELIEGSRDALSFVIHDLVHAYKMFEDEILFKGQVAFSILMNKVINLDIIREFLHNDNDFKENFYYLVADMNSHTKHMFFHFKTCLINAFKARYGLHSTIKLDTNQVAFEDFNRNFELILNLFDMNEFEKESARSMLESSSNFNDQFNSFDFTVLNNFFLNIYDLNFK